MAEGSEPIGLDASGNVIDGNGRIVNLGKAIISGITQLSAPPFQLDGVTNSILRITAGLGGVQYVTSVPWITIASDLATDQSPTIAAGAGDALPATPATYIDFYGDGTLWVPGYSAP